MTTFVGYDPGGNKKHGVAVLRVGSSPATLEAHTARDGHEVLEWLESRCPTPPAAIGIDTLLSWELGWSGWRGADVALRERYPEVKNSIASSNSLYGSMCVQGPAVALSLRSKWPSIGVTETHPKVLYFALSRKKYDWAQAASMKKWLLSEFTLAPGSIANDHEWDAIASAAAAWRGFSGHWQTDLMDRARNPVAPMPNIKYFWPERI